MMTKKKKEEFFHLMKIMALAVALLYVTACTKPRNAEIQDEQMASQTFAISELQGKDFQMVLEGTSGAEAISDKPQVISVKPSTKIQSTTLPIRLQGLFHSVPARGKAGHSYDLNFSVSRSYVNIEKVVSRSEDISSMEKQISRISGSSVRIPFAKIPVKTYGVLQRAKNENKEETSSLVLVETDFDRATHVVLSLKNEDLMVVGDARTPDEADRFREIVGEEKLENKVTTLAALKENLQLSIEGADQAKVLTRIEKDTGTKVSVLIYRIIKVSDVKDEKILKKLASGDSREIARCDKDITQHLATEEKGDCVILLSHIFDAEKVQAKLDTNELGQETPRLRFEPLVGSNAGSSTLLRIVRNTQVTGVGIDEQRTLNPFQTVRITDIKGKEFKLRRTFEDGASAIMVFGPGASGELDVVNFELEDQRIVVKRATSVNGDRTPGTIDKEELMSIPVQSYLKRDPHSAAFKLVKASPETAEYVNLDWTSNQIPVLNSPLAFFDAGQCFRSVANQTVTDLDNRMSTGVLNFSINGTYQFTPDCMSWYGLNDYWYGGALQGTFNIKERVSFIAHDKKLDNTPGRDLPFRAQNLLGFGVFTTGKLSPDDFGNAGRIGTEKALPVIHDFSGGQTITYVLGGLPASGWMRAKLIEGTREVVADWNAALVRAFKGTNLERSTPYIVLKVDGEDGPAGRLGDLDKNYIWNFEKNLDSGLLGMSQAGPNPRSGRIEQNNVLMYSGNLLSQIGSMKEMAKLQRLYEESKQAALEEALKSKSSKSTATGKLAEVKAEILKQIAKSKANMQPKVTAAGKPSSQVQSRVGLTALRSEMQKAKDSLQVDARKQSYLTQESKTAAMYLNNIFKKATAQDITHDEAQLNALSAAEILKAYGSRLSPEIRHQLSVQSHRLAMMAQFEKNFSKGPNCALTARMASAKDIENTPTEDVFKDFYKSTLAHEIGHSLGLTHNFKGSLDGKNFLFTGEANNAKARNYSSIMDYIPDEQMHYQGPGPYDVKAIRSAYTGLVEVHPAIAAAATVVDGKKVVTLADAQGEPVTVSIVGSSEITLDDFKKVVLGSNSWWRLDKSYGQLLPLKKYEYCTDKDVGTEPTCNRWDMGTTPMAIADYFANEYRDLYPVLNSRGSRINIRGIDSYIGRIFYQMFNLRFFLEETFFKALSGEGPNEFIPVAIGALKALEFYTEVVSAPSKSARFNDASRYQPFEYEFVKFDPETGEPVIGEDGKPVTETAVTLVESKPVGDLAVPGMPTQVDTRGIEFDKAIALIMLTSRDLGHPKYESISLRLSFAEFEKYLLGADTVEQSTVLSTLKNILQDQPKAMTLTAHGLKELPAQWEATTTEIVRMYALLGASVFLDSDAMEDKYNFASLFRVTSKTTAPQDRLFVTKLDQDYRNAQTLKFFASNNADASNGLVRKTVQKRVVLEAKDKVADLLIKAVLEEKAKKAAAEGSTASSAAPPTTAPPVAAESPRDQLVKVVTELNKNGVLINAEEAAAGQTVESQVDATIAKTGEVFFLGMLLSMIGEVPELADLLTEITRVNSAEAKEVPLIAIAYKAAVKIAEGDDALTAGIQSIADDSVLESSHGIVVNNLNTMNRIMIQMYPELQ